MPLENTHIPDGADGLLKFSDTMGSEGSNLLIGPGGFSGATANTVAHKITCRVDAPTLIDIAPCPQHAPNKPNVFTDGSLEGNTTSFTCGGFGAWSRGRDQEDITAQELLLASRAEVPAGHRHAGSAIAGSSYETFSSSTRQEISAMIVSIPRPNATHIASDSRAAVDKAMSVIEGTLKLRRPWILQVDGDLWYTFAPALAAKGYHSFRATWVKGHVTMQTMPCRYLDRV